MSFKKFFAVLFLALILSPVYKTYAANSATKTAPSSAGSIEDTIIEKTPGFIYKPLVSLIDKTEKFRIDTGITWEINKKAAQKEIDSLSSEIAKNQFIGVAEYSKLYFWSFLAFVFKIKFVFYIISLVVVFIIFRFVALLFFS